MTTNEAMRGVVVIKTNWKNPITGKSIKVFAFPDSHPSMPHCRGQIQAIKRSALLYNNGNSTAPTFWVNPKDLSA